MDINFYLPNFGIKSKVNGGYKVVYQYANFLAQNHNVNIYYDIEEGKNNLKIWPQIYIKFKKIVLKYNYPKWFKLDKRVRQYAVEKIDDEFVLNADVSIATAYETAKPVRELSRSKGIKIYFIQDYEKWNGRTDKELIDSYKLDMKKIVISNWLKDKVKLYTNDEIRIISNGIDTENVFKIKRPVEIRKKHSIMMLYHENPRKGCKDGIKVLKKLKERYPELQVQLFGSPRRKKLPKWIKYDRNINEFKVAELMNENAIYLCTSLQEGYGLPGLEAMACGCALVTTNCKGILEYANESNAMITEPEDVDDMYKKICYLIDNEDERIKLAKKGNQDVISSKNIEFKFREFEKYITGGIQ